MLYLCHLINGRGQVGDLLLAWHDAYGLCSFSVQGFYLRNDNLESIAIPAVYNMLELKELLDE